MQEIAWGTDEILNDFRDKGVDFLIPIQWEFGSMLMCTEPLVDVEDFSGKQIRVGSVTDSRMVEALGGSPVSMAFTEAYEALQRNAIDCTFGAMKTGHESGFIEVAPYVTFPSTGSWGRAGVAWISGVEVASLPLAARQLIFDKTQQLLSGHINYCIEYNVLAVADIRAKDGDIFRLSEEADELLNEVAREMKTEVAESSNFDGAAVVDAHESLIEKWTAVAEELGYEHVDEWMDFADSDLPESIDASAFTDRVFEEVYLPNRPS